MSFNSFHSSIKKWFSTEIGTATQTQKKAWRAITAKQHTLIAAPTGRGKSLAAFLAVIDELIKQRLNGSLENRTWVVYISPLKALSSDIEYNLQSPLKGIAERLYPFSENDHPLITTGLRTGDTSASERQRMRRCPPHILVTTPESLYLLLTSDSGRNMLKTVRTVIIDEIHALISSKRGSHLALSLERLYALCPQTPMRIGLSATQKPIHLIRSYLVGNRNDHVTIIDEGYHRNRDLKLILPHSPLEALMSAEVWQELYDHLTELIQQHRTTLIFVNTRRMAERIARFLAERISAEEVAAHHGSLSRKHRQITEQRLKQGKLKALVATASLELGIDIGEIDLVCQLGSPRAISVFLQRIGRSGHTINGTPKGRLFPLSRDDLVECTALLKAIHDQQLDTLQLPQAHLDVLAQQIIAEVSCGERTETALLKLIRFAYSYQTLTAETFQQVLHMLAQGYSLKRGIRGRYIQRDQVNHIIKPRKGPRLISITNGGAIPDQFDFDVVLQPEDLKVGTLNEDFSVESLPGDIFQLGNTAYRILRIQHGKVYVQDAHGLPPNIPFWFGEAPGRSNELSHAVSELKHRFDQVLQNATENPQLWLQQHYDLEQHAAEQLSKYLSISWHALGSLPSQKRVILERFFDEQGDQHLVLHSSFGIRVNRAWGLALRKRFCRQFNFELQAAALDDSIVLSLGSTHSFALEDVKHYLKSIHIKETLKQALLTAPLFNTHWRWNATIALAIKRKQAGNKVPPQFQRSDAEDLMALIFPDSLACQENIQGEREIPDHPLVNQTIEDCLNDVMDIKTLEIILRQLEASEITFICRDLSAPSPLAQEILTARPYAFLDDAPAEERRTQVVTVKRFIEAEDARALRQLDQNSITQCQQQAWPTWQTADELHDALYQMGFLIEAEIEQHQQKLQIAKELMQTLNQQGRACVIKIKPNRSVWCCAERLIQWISLYPNAALTISIQPAGILEQQQWEPESSLKELLRTRLHVLGPITAETLAKQFQLKKQHIELQLLALQQEGFVMQGNWTQECEDTEWCERSLLARMHQMSLRRLRREIRPISPQQFQNFLFRWHGVEQQTEGEEALYQTLQKLSGFSAAACSWENTILPARIKYYSPDLLDQLTVSGRILWQRYPENSTAIKAKKYTRLGKNTPIMVLPRQDRAVWDQLHHIQQPAHFSSSAEKVVSILQEQGAQFFSDLIQATKMLPTQLEMALAELASMGVISSDNFSGIRAFIKPASTKKPSYRRRYTQTRELNSLFHRAGRWFWVDTEKTAANHDPNNEQYFYEIINILLNRYGVIFKTLLERENKMPPWRELLYYLRRMEARGEIRGGRFVNLFSGEQFALPDVIPLLRKKSQTTHELVAICACDPLNLEGILSSGNRIPAVPHHHIIYKKGKAIAWQTHNDIHYLDNITEEESWLIKNKLFISTQLLSKKYRNKNVRH